jgi:hypothetical protein
MFYINRLLAMSMIAVAMMIRSIGLNLTCLTGSHEELYRLLPESLHLVSTTRHEHDSRCNDDRVFPNRSDQLDRILSNLLDGLT